MRVVTLPLPLETPTKVSVLNRQRCNILQLEQCCLGSYGSSYRLSLYGSPKHAVGNIIDNNIANGVSSEGVVYDDLDTFLFRFRNKTDYYNWWERRYGESSVGTDRNYVLINYP